MLTGITDISHWVEDGNDDRDTKRRKAIHTTLYAIATSDSLKAHMAMKGGILMAIKYQSSRYTRDIDFSTSQTVSDFNENLFFEEFNKTLLSASNNLDYGLECCVQTYKKNR